MDALFGRLLSAHQVAWVETRVGISWKLDLSNATHRWIVYGYYEGYAFWRWFVMNRGNIRTVIDSGANIGQTTLYFARLLSHARIFAYEPGCVAREWLSSCVKHNALGNVSIRNTGLGDGSRQAFLRSVGDSTTHGSWNRIDDREGEAVQLIALDAEISRLGLNRIDLWKLDMEGGEIAALKGADNALAGGLIGAIHVEMFAATGPIISQTLIGYGYRPFVSWHDRLVPARESFAYNGENILFVHPLSGLRPPA